MAAEVFQLKDLFARKGTTKCCHNISLFTISYKKASMHRGVRDCMTRGAAGHLTGVSIGK